MSLQRAVNKAEGELVKRLAIRFDNTNIKGVKFDAALQGVALTLIE